MLRLRRRVEGPFFFVHLQKTGGTSLISQMRTRFGRPAIYPDVSDHGPDHPGDLISATNVDHLLQRWQARRDEIEIVTGHFPLCTAELLDADFRTFTLLREPVARTLSSLRHHRELIPKDRSLTLTELYDEPFKFHGLIHNHMVKMFSLTLDEMTEGAFTPVTFTPDRLETAKRALESLDVVGVLEDYDRFCKRLERTYGWRLGDRRHMNTTEPAEVDPGLVERIVADNAMDIELYEFALELTSRRAKRP